MWGRGCWIRRKKYDKKGNNEEYEGENKDEDKCECEEEMEGTGEEEGEGVGVLEVSDGVFVWIVDLSIGVLVEGEVVVIFDDYLVEVNVYFCMFNELRNSEVGRWEEDSVLINSSVWEDLLVVGLKLGGSSNRRGEERRKRMKK